MYFRYFAYSGSILIIFAISQTTNGADKYTFPAPYFLPGDAFFHTIVTEKVLKKLDEDPDYAFEYDVSHWQLHNAGYYSLSLGKQNRKLTKQIKEVYYGIRRDFRPLVVRIYGKSPNSVSDETLEKKTELVEINGLSLFFYNEDYDWQKMHIALKYNENWYQELTKFGYPDEDYGAFVKTPEAIIQSWRFSTAVPPLSVQLPEESITKKQAIRAPMIATGRLRAIMLHEENSFKQYYKRENNLSLVEITNEDYFHFFAGEGKWHKIGE